MSQKIYIGNLASSVVNETLASKFSKYGIVYSANVMTDKETNRSMGYAFVEMASSADAQKAIKQLNGSVIEGKLVNVAEVTKTLLH